MFCHSQFEREQMDQTLEPMALNLLWIRLHLPPVAAPEPRPTSQSKSAAPTASPSNSTPSERESFARGELDFAYWVSELPKRGVTTLQQIAVLTRSVLTASLPKTTTAAVIELDSTSLSSMVDRICTRVIDRIAPSEASRAVCAIDGTPLVVYSNARESSSYDRYEVNCDGCGAENLTAWGVGGVTKSDRTYYHCDVRESVPGAG